MKKLSQAFTIFLLAASLAACSGGGDGGSSSSPTSPSPTTPATTSVSGAVSKGPVSNAAVNIFMFNTDGTQGTLVLDGITTDANGAWSANIPSTATGPFMIIATGGTFTDEYTGATVPLGVVPMRGILPVGATSAAITPITDAAVSTIQQMVTNGYASSPDNALSAVQTNYVDSIGFNPIAIIPPAPSNLAGATADQLRYAAVLGGISTLANDAYTQLSTGGNTPDRMEIIAQMANDFAADGSIDGYGNAAAPLTVNVGGVAQALNGVFTGGGNLGAAVGTYQGLPTAPATVAGATVTITPVDFAATLFADTTNPVVTPPSSINISVTTGTTSVPASDATIAAFLSGATASDNIGVVGSVTHNAPTSFPVGTTTVIFSAVDAAGNTGTASATVTITIQTTIPEILIASPMSNSTFTKDITGFVAIPITVNISNFTLSSGAWNIILDGVAQTTYNFTTSTTLSRNLTVGSHTIKVQLTGPGKAYTPLASQNTDTITVNIQAAVSGGGGGGTITLNASTYCPVNPTTPPLPTMNGWQWSYPSPQGASLRSIVEGNGVFLAAGDVGQMLRSTDKVTWTPVASGTTSNINKIIWDGTAFIIPGDPIAISCDGLNWVRKPLVATLNGTTTTTFVPSRMILADKYFTFHKNAIYQSTDAVNWTGNTVSAVTAIGNFASFNLVANNGTTFVAKTLNPEATLVSNDSGTTWQTVAAAPTGYRLLFWNGTQFVADLGQDIATSTDGINWLTTTTNGGIAFNTVWVPYMIYYRNQALRYGGNDFTQISSYNNNGALQGLDGSNTWVGLDGNYSSGSGLRKINAAIVTSTNSLLVVGDAGMIAEQTGTLNGVNNKSWLRHSSESSSGLLTGIATNGTSFVAVGNAPDILHSTDGINWTRVALPTFKFAVWSSPTPIDDSLDLIQWTGTEYVAISGTGMRISSTDGLTWTIEVKPKNGNDPYPVASTYFNNSLLWKGQSRVAGNIVTTSDPASGATLVGGATTAKYGGYANNGTRAVAVGNFGISTTTNGTTWTPASLATITNNVNFDFTGVAYNGTKFLATAVEGVNSVILESIDGLSWTQITVFPNQVPNLGATTNRNILSGSGGKFVIFRGAKDPIESLDGATWTHAFASNTTLTNINAYIQPLYNSSSSYVRQDWAGYLNTGTKEIYVGFRNGILTK